MESTRTNNYDRVAGVYDAAAHIYSGGQIRACKEAQLSEICAGDRVLYAGAGRGYDAALAAKAGAQVTVIELSRAMANNARRHFREVGVAEQIELIEGDAFEFDRPAQYDVVVANFFLNVFSEPLMKKMMKHLAAQLRLEGKFLVSDFAPTPGSRSQSLYFRFACRAFGLLADNAIHPIYDYSSTFDSAQIRLERKHDFPLFGVGPRWYRTWAGRRTLGAS